MNSSGVFSERTKRAAWPVFCSTLGVACFATIAGFLGDHWWVLDLASHFRAQYVAILGAGAIVLLVRRKLLAGLLVAGFALVNLYLVGAYGVTAYAATGQGIIDRPLLRAMVVNVNQSNRRYEKVIEYVKAQRPDFIVLVEINESWRRALEPLRELYPFERARPANEYGIVLLSRIPYQDAVIEIMGENGTPTVMANFYIKGRHLTLIGTHPRSPTTKANASSRDQQLGSLAKIIASTSDPVILLGDLNITPWSPVFQDFVSAAKLRDTRRGFGLQATWPTTMPLFLIPIDHCLVSPQVVVRNRTVGPYVGSDHYPVVVDFYVGNDS